MTDAQPDGWVTLTRELIDACKTNRGGFDRFTLATLGVTWPPQHGWPARVVGKRLAGPVYASLVERARSTRPAKVRPVVTDRLFAQPEPVLGSDLPFTGTRVDGVLHFDGSAWPNPGPTRCGYVLRYGTRVIERTVDLGHGTNNTAEYHGLIRGMRDALAVGVTHLEVYGDSQLVVKGVRRMRGWAKGKPHLEALKAEAIGLIRQFAAVDLNWVPREENAEADALSTSLCGAAS